MRGKMTKQSEKEYRCCCCHVRTGTTILGCLQMIACLFSLLALSFAFFYPDLINTQKNSNLSDFLGDVKQQNSWFEVSPTEGAEDVQSDYSSYSSWNWAVNSNTSSYESLCFALFVTLLMLISAMMMIYGVMKGVPSFLMPNFVLQVFYFALTCLNIIGCFATVDDIKVLLTQFLDRCNAPVEWKEEVQSMDSHWLTLIVAAVVVCILLFKAYLINVVYSCYKYLTYVRASQRVTNGITHYMDTGDGEDVQMLLPPKYEEVVNVDQPAPPPYTSN